MRRIMIMMTALFMALTLGTVNSSARVTAEYNPDVDYMQYIDIDRYLNVEVWTDDDEYYEGDNIQISFRASEDCYVAIYNIDTRGHINLIFPDSPNQDNWVEGGYVYTIPGRYDDYDLTVQGPEGIEHLQIIASKKPFRMPDWYRGSGIISSYDAYDFMEFIAATYFECNGHCRFALDVTSFQVKEWHRHYFRPVYTYHHYPHWDWSYYGGVYIDYPFGATIYIDGVYWGVAPLFIPRIYWGWHYVTIYDRYGYCWEDRIHVYREKRVVLDRTVINTREGVKSRFKDVRKQGYLNPARNGYPDYSEKVRTKKAYKPVSQTHTVTKDRVLVDKNTRGTTVTGKRTGYESSVTKGRSTGAKRESTERYKSTTKKYRSSNAEKRSSNKTYDMDRSKRSTESRGYKTDRSKSTDRSRSSDRSSTKSYRRDTEGSSKRSTESYRKSSGSSKSSDKSYRRSSDSRSKSSDRSYRRSTDSKSEGSSGSSSKRSGGSYKSSGSSKSSSSSSKYSGSRGKSSGGTAPSKSSGKKR